jgi:hypothetical protein
MSTRWPTRLDGCVGRSRTRVSTFRKMVVSFWNILTAKMTPPARSSTTCSRSPICSSSCWKKAAWFARLFPRVSARSEISLSGCWKGGAICACPPPLSATSTAVVTRSASTHPETSGMPAHFECPAALAVARQILLVNLTCRASHFLLSWFRPIFLLTSYAAIATHLWKLGARLFLPALLMTHLITFHRVGFLQR